MADDELDKHVSSDTDRLTSNDHIHNSRGAMSRIRNRRWKSCLMWFASSIGALFWTVGCIGVTGEDVPEMPVNFKPESCKAGNRVDQYLMVVSTIDGKVSALDVKNDGKLVWSVQADTRALLSSSISKLEMTRNGIPVRLIPSLDGGLYQYDGESIEAVPLTADSLLSSSFKLADDTMMVGGKDLHTYGINPYTGQIQYSCTTEGCQYFGEVEDEADILVITRNTQTVRAVDSRSGVEKWNFSVGQHELTFLEGHHPKYAVTNDFVEEDDVTIVTCPGTDEAASTEDEEKFEGNLKVVVPQGLVVGLSPDNEEVIQWQHKFASPVSSAWILHKKALRPISIFDHHHVPALSSFKPDDPTQKEPLLYIGSHQKQMYVQPSPQLQEQAADAVSQSGNSWHSPMPKVAWKPYLVTAASRTPILRGNREPPLLGYEEGEENSDETSVSVWHENYPYDRGYYIYPEVTTKLPVKDGEKAGNMSKSAEASEMESFTMSLWNWWKEVIAISVVTSVLVHILLTKYFHQHHQDISVTRQSDSDIVEMERKDHHAVEDVSIPMHYTSRYTTEFEHVQCLGKGGFGIVFESRNKMDDCHYALKRISLPATDDAKEKVMREVRALAKLDHVGIVRYFHAWLEMPPVGWQEARDRELEDSECFSNPTPCNSVSENWSVPYPVLNRDYIISIPKPFGGSPNSVDQSQDLSLAGGSSEFSVIEEEQVSENEESGSFSIGKSPSKHCVDNNDSFEIEFKHSDTEDNIDNTNNNADIPFQCYESNNDAKIRIEDTGSSMGIVFEDSGCGEKSSNSDSNNINKNFNHNNNKHISGTISLSRRTEPCVAKHYLFIQMQLCQRETLKDWLAANTVSRDRHLILDMFDQIVSAVEYVHDNSLMHRDLKPSNIFFSKEGVIKVGDFGLATAMAEQQDSENSETDDKIGKHTAQVGTQIYMSPEQISGKIYSHKVDIFALGIILFELFYPFATQMERVKILSNVKRKIFPDKFRSEMSTECKFLEWLVSEDPADRPSAKQILDSDLLKDFQPRRQPRTLRSRTISGDSDNSVKI